MSADHHPSAQPVGHALVSVGFSEADAAQIVEDCYGTAADPARVAAMARGTVGVFRSAGVFEVPGAQDAFAAAGLVTG